MTDIKPEQKNPALGGDDAVLKSDPEDAAQKEFLKILSHELRNPLATILSSIELISARELDAKETPKLLAVVSGQVRAMSSLLDDLLSASHIPQNKFKLQQGPASLKERHRVETTPPHESGALKVLVVDDNEIAADSMAQLLSLRGYHVEVAYGGTEGLEKALSFRPQVAILDIGMPELDGYALVGLLRAENLPCTYVALTGYGEKNDKEKILLAGFDYHLTKPTGLEEIEVILKKVTHVLKKQA